MTVDVMLPNAEQLHKAFRGEGNAALTSVIDAASRMIPIHHKRKEAIRRMQQPDGMSGNELRRAVGDFTAAESSLASLATAIDRSVATALQGRQHVSGVWHTETVGLVISRMAELWLSYINSQAHEDAFRVARMSDAYNFLITELAEGRRLPPDM
ncbi:hypothetical protein [Nocardia pseudovaccinii]|uniref:hypothetical protein n=1 Tax=Nocardia pseudovaccinii TaxID=189540 RepID=UPI0007A546DA|nr:hypothetical protein [Nocardia pseudovaccinii]